MNFRGPNSSAFSLCSAFYSAFPSAAIFPQPEKQSLIRDVRTVSGVENFLGLCCPESISPELCFLEDAFTEHTSLGRPFLCPSSLDEQGCCHHTAPSFTAASVRQSHFLWLSTVHHTPKWEVTLFRLPSIHRVLPLPYYFLFQRVLPGCLIKHCVTSPLPPLSLLGLQVAGCWTSSLNLVHFSLFVSPLFSSCITSLGIDTFQKFFSQFWKLYCQTHPLRSEFFLLCFLFPMLKFYSIHLIVLPITLM